MKYCAMRIDIIEMLLRWTHEIRHLIICIYLRIRVSYILCTFQRDKRESHRALMRVNFRSDHSIRKQRSPTIRESPICSWRGIRREIRYRAVRNSFPQTRKPRCRRIPAKLLPTGKLSDLPSADAGCFGIRIVQRSDLKKKRDETLVPQWETEVLRMFT